MNKFYILMSAALVAASASAAEKEMMASPKTRVKTESFKSVASSKERAKLKTEMSAAKFRKAPQRVSKAEEYAYFLPAENVMAFGMSTNGYGLINGTGFASPYGSLEFTNYSVGSTSFEWLFSDLNEFNVVNDAIEWITQTSDVENLQIKSGVGYLMAPELTVKYDGNATETYTLPRTTQYRCGGGADYWLGEDQEGGIFGITAYQNSGLKNPQGYSGSSTYRNSYQVGAAGYNANGVYIDPSDRNNWNNMVQEEFEDAEITNLALENFYIIQPKPQSMYFMTTGWLWCNVTATAATSLTSYVYPINDEGKITENPIAIGYGTVARGSSDTLEFEYFPLNEDGDEEEGQVFIDTAVAITVEGFLGNSAIKEITPVSGYYPCSYEAYASGNYDIIREPNLLLNFTMEVDGEPASIILYNRGLYYYDQTTKPGGGYVDDDTLTLLAYAQFSMNATYPWILTSNGEESVTLPLEGGSVTLDVNALYYNINANLEEEEGMYELSTPDWVTVTFGDSDQETGDTPMTITVDASDENRVGEVVLSGLGVAMNLKVVQGEDTGVNEIQVANGAAVYYDLQGRKLNQAPEKGIYIVKEGNKVSKVIR